ncbi:cytochrome P450 [Saccharata proteae CBS 121410]|uniref:Bifunctional cytochrome P450/NADPH--P450 reductase n=1 Tax=Saccharata proteae CBS 121410 TaxID=1314787 RepID=A0A6A5YAP8_9PEZI|nr:cytochrome P450 [Saccharata proteae CBS 121410]
MSGDGAPIPQPPGYPFVGNIADLDPEFPLGSLVNLANTYGSIYRLNLGGQDRVIIGTQELLNEVCDEKRFRKCVAAGLKQVRNGVHDGLFTAYGPEEKNWGIAHRVLIPAFGPLSIRGMFDEMHDIASQLVLKWARHGSDHSIQVTDDFTRLTLDTLALCAMDYRFNSYYQDQMHPFIEAMADFLKESGNRANRPTIAQAFYRSANAKYDADIELLQKTSYEVIKNRRANPTDRKDLLNAMLQGRDTRTGEGLNDQSIMDNMITFLIAGHETTSGLLSFAFYYLVKNPQAYQKAQKEVDEVIGSGRITVEHLSKLPYINAVLRETLRLTPTAPAFTVQADKPEILAGKYQIGAGEPIVCLLPKVHRDPAVYGEDAEAWRPERMLDENFERLNREFPNCWKPFGNGMRGCIGRPFAWQEAQLVTAMLLQNFDFVAEDPSYTLQFKQTLTIKPKDFAMRATLRNKLTPTQLEHALQTTSLSEMDVSAAGAKRTGAVSKPAAAVSTGVGLSIFYGSNTGTCEALARRLAGDAAAHGFQVKKVDALDAYERGAPPDHPVAIITASYEGQPADNAAHFVAWLEGLNGNEMEKLSYSVFGCGHHDWAQTFHRIPKHVDNLLQERGGKRIATLGTADAAAGDMFTDFENWEDQVFWPAMVQEYGGSEKSSATAVESNFQVEISSPRASVLKQEVKEARVVESRVISAPGVPKKCHIEIQLPSDMSYSAGDYLAILPLNPKENVQRAMRYFGLAWDSMLTISSTSPTTLPTDRPISAVELFGAYIELAQPASKRNVTVLSEATEEPQAKESLAHLSGPAFATEISAKRVSVLDLLERFPSITLPINSFLQMQPPMRVRQYSISSSPLWNPSHVTLSYAVLDQPSMSGQGRFVGVASNYLSSLGPGDKLHVSIRPSNQAFRPPTNAEQIPIICICAGTGIAPFRGFVQERAAQIAAGRKLAPALLFFGCHSADTDDLYRDELDKWEAMGAVAVRRAYSRDPGSTKGCKYVQDRLWEERAEVVDLWEKDAKVFVCGSGEVGEAVKQVSLKIAMARAEEQGREPSIERAEKWFEGIRNDRFATDVFA